MKLTIYKGFDAQFLSSLEKEPLFESSIDDKLNVLTFDKKKKKQLNMALLSMEEADDVWATYEEFTIIKSSVDDAVKDYGLELEIMVNNLYPDYYPLPFYVPSELAREIEHDLNTDVVEEESEACQRFLDVYNTLLDIDGVFFGSFYNYEYEKEENIQSKAFYPSVIAIEGGQDSSEYNVFINEDVETYLRDLARIKSIKPAVIGVRSTDGLVSKRFLLSLQAYCVANGIRMVEFHEQLEEDIEMEKELISIAKNEIKMANFKGFRSIRFYKNPDINKETIEVSQSTLIQAIIHQAEKSYDDTKGHSFRDIFITASTGAGKSVMFQIPAIYLAKKYGKLTIVIEPVKALMQDQKEKLMKNGYTRVEAFNSDIISQVEKEAALKRIKDGEIDLLYLSPETLLSYSIETIIGDRDIGLLIVDEAHIVTTWGMGFRPDYWYLGGYINRLRTQIQTTVGKQRTMYHFPICAFTATAINGGVDDSVSDTVISLNMENPIKYLGYVRRDDIGFDIVQCETKKLSMSDYESQKTKSMDARIKKWLHDKTKTIVYFPYATNAVDASRGVRGFGGITTDKRIGVFTGKNVDDVSTETFAEQKRKTFDKFRSGEQHIMYATKAFGMGVDIDDVECVYHYAASGNLSDYVQEIGRAARKSNMTGVAATDYYYNDLSFMNKLFGMSQIQQYQIKKVLEGIYNTYKSKNGARSFLIAPGSFTYIFNGKGVQNEDSCINKLKTCLLMLEKDLYDKYTFKVIISRPQSVFTKAFVVIHREYEKEVLSSKYGKCFKLVSKGRESEPQPDGSLLSDTGDIYTLDLKRVWEEYHPNISFPQFKYWYFNANSQAKDKVEIMPSVRSHFGLRQKVNIEARGDYLLNEIRELILEDFEYIGNTLYSTFGKSYFSIDDFAKAIREKYGATKARIISNSLFDLVDPNGTCVKHRSGENSIKTYKTYYSLANGNFKEYMRKSIIKANIMYKISQCEASSFSGFMGLANDEWSNIALKLLSVFDYITYEVLGGEEPEIFIRLNDPYKIKNIVLGNTFYSNSYVNRAKQKHDRDVMVLLRFFNELKTDRERWDFIEEYFLGYDVLCDVAPEPVSSVAMSRSIDKEKSYPTHEFKKWTEMMYFFDESDHIVIENLAKAGVPIPEYLETTLKKSDLGENIVMSWPSKNVLICSQDIPDEVMGIFRKKGWTAYRLYEINIDELKGGVG